MRAEKQNILFRFRFFFWFSLVVFLFSSLSCTRASRIREGFSHSFPDGTDDDLYPVSILAKSSNHPSLFPEKTKDGLYKIENLKIRDLNNLNSLLKIRTASQGKEVKISVSEENVVIDPKISFLNEYFILDYEIVTKPRTELQKKLKQWLSEGIEFNGFPSKDYYIAPHYDTNFLILYKVGQKEIIPYDELPLAVEVGEGIVAVPFIGYPIEYCRAEVIYIDGEITGQYRPLCEGVLPKEAEYFRLKERDKKEFEYLLKPDLFPKDFFKGRWFYVRTIVKSPEERVVGHSPFQAAKLVEFQETPENLDVVDASGYKFQESDKIRALFIPISWKDYEIEREAGNISRRFKEKLKEESLDIKRPWFKIKFKELVETKTEFRGEKSFKNLFITNDYFSFNIEITEEGSGAYLLKYAFRRAVENPDYIEKQWFEEDSNLFFPSFAERRRYHKRAIDHTQADNDRFFRVTRFDPKKQEIKWYFSKQSSKEQWVRDLGYQAEALLNKAFQEAGKGSKHKIKISLNEMEEPPEVGDIRYNILNLIDEESSGGGLFGLGPNVANPITGEAISATANIWVGNIVASYIDIVRKYIRFQIYPPAWKLLHSSPGVTDFLDKKIQKDCKEVTNFIRDNEGLVFHPDPNKSPSLDDDNAIKTCAQKLAQIKILETIQHEMLHGLALRHVFSASADSDNYYKTFKEAQNIFGFNIPMDKTKSHPHPPQFSSLMDYFDLQHPILPVPGKLDIAALRFIYFDKVKLKNGGFLEVPAGADKDPENPQKSILATAISEGLSKEDIKSYRVCGGKKWREDQSSEIDPDDPLCFQFDYGNTPLAIVKNAIRRVKDTIMTGRNRHDSENITFESFARLKRTVSQIWQIYNKWTSDYKNVLLKKHGKKEKDYFFSIDSLVTEYTNLMEIEEKNNSEFKKYYDVRQTLFDFFKELVFLPVKHCIYKESDNLYKALALENIEKQISSQDPREVLINCKSPVVEENWEDKPGRLIMEVGYFGQNKKYFLKPTSKDSPDIASLFSSDEITIFSNIVKNLKSLLYEPDFAKRYYEEISNYIFLGLNLNPYIDKTLAEKSNMPLNEKGEADLPPFLSYKIDTDTIIPFEKEMGLFETRWNLFNSITKDISENTGNPNIKKEWNRLFKYEEMPLTKLTEHIEGLEKNPQHYTKENEPFFYQVYQEYQTEKNWSEEPLSLATYIMERHPAIVKPIRPTGESVFFIPHNNKTSFTARLFRKYNKYLKCIEDHFNEISVCDNIEEKQAFVKAIETTHLNKPNSDDVETQGKRKVEIELNGVVPED